MPTRETIRASAPPQAKPVHPAKPGPAPLALGLQERGGAGAESLSWDERLGPIGIISVAMFACVVVWAVMTYLF